MLPQMYHSWEASLDVFRIRKKDNPLDENGRIVLKRGDPPGRIVYVDSAVSKRTDESFRSYENSGFHNGHCDLTRLPIDIEADFLIDPMHCLYIGTVKTLLGTISNPGSTRCPIDIHRSSLGYMISQGYPLGIQTFWPFFWENDLGVIGRMFTKGAFPLPQIVKRIYEAETNLIFKKFGLQSVN